MDDSRRPLGFPGMPPGHPVGGMPFRPPFGGGAGMPDFALGMPELDVSHISRKWLDLPYAGISPSHTLDIYLPENGDGPFPMIFYTHGGAFAIGDKRDPHLPAFLHGLERGYAVVSANYRLSGEATFPAGLQDAKAAIRWVRANAHLYRLDPDRIAAAGGSSGGNYAAMICVTAGEPLFDDPSLGNANFPSHVQAGVDWFGPTDFSKMDAHLAANGLGPCDHSLPESPESRYLGAALAEVPETVRLANPMTYVNVNMPPLLIQHGSADNLVPVQQSMEFAEVIERRVDRGRCEFDILFGAGHDDPAFSTPENLERVFSFLDRCLK